MRIRNTIVEKNCPATHAGVLAESSGMICHIAHTAPKIRSVVNALHRSCKGRAAYPIQPTSSPTAARKNTTKKIGIIRKGMYGSGSGRLKRSITPYESTMTRGIKGSAYRNVKIGRAHV